MGLDQYAYRKDRESGTSDFSWRKHAKLQTWMEQLFIEKTGGSVTDFNCSEFELELADIEKLEEDIRNDNLPTCLRGFFYGHQWQDESAEDYREQDLKFCQWAKQAIKDGDSVIYHSWW